MIEFPYTSVQEYLSEQFAHLSEVTDTMVLDAKRRYNSLYQAWYKENYKQKFAQITLTFKKSDLAKLRNRAKQEQTKLSTFIKRYLNQTEGISPQFLLELTVDIERCLDMVEEALYEQEFELLKQLQQQLETIKSKL